MADSPDPEIQFHAPPPEFGQGDDQNDHDDHEYEEERRYSRDVGYGDASERRNYDILVSKLQQRFGCTRQQSRWLSRFESRKRLPCESIAMLRDELRQLSQKAYTNLDPRAKEALALNQLYKSVSLEMKCRCIDKECATISDAVQVIERYEAILGEPPVTEKKKTAVRQISTDDDKDYSFGQLNARVAKLEQTSYNTPTTNPRPCIKQMYHPKGTAGKLQTVNVERPYLTDDSSNGPGKENYGINDNCNKRIGQLGKTCGKFDNGFYAVGEICGLHVEFLVDTGSTTTLLACKMFDQILERNKPNLEPSRLNIKDVNGNTITAYGQSIMNLNFNGKLFPQTIIVCDISPDAIIGQDFLLHYVNTIDYQRMVLQTSLTDIQCWVAGVTQMVCRVEVKEEITIPANSRMFLPVDIPFC
ncbi:unnamed protein product [Mytilus coruscus]|uniref:Peptidase A2 domain-containing protein n=1 Tax=Mytilus coruscus TaxID=42192 RepID=A0A6J8E291_MYTCO|nr:unnamed protein product [Mytilus coruscus]